MSLETLQHLITESTLFESSDDRSIRIFGQFSTTAGSLGPVSSHTRIHRSPSCPPNCRTNSDLDLPKFAAACVHFNLHPPVESLLSLSRPLKRGASNIRIALWLAELVSATHSRLSKIRLLWNIHLACHLCLCSWHQCYTTAKEFALKVSIQF